MKKILSTLLMLVGITIIEGCSDLNEEVLDETSAGGLSQKQEADGLIAPAYASFADLFLHTRYFTLQEISTDEAILPYRGGTDWGDNGIYIEMHTHNFSTTDPNMRETWNTILKGVSRCVSAINSLPTLNDPAVKTYLAEARALKAYYSMLTLDMFGLVFV
jgi:hypothetical protein